jgi:hypothetical protein
MFVIKATAVIEGVDLDSDFNELLEVKTYFNSVANVCYGGVGLSLF